MFLFVWFGKEKKHQILFFSLNNFFCNFLNSFSLLFLNFDGCVHKSFLSSFERACDFLKQRLTKIILILQIHTIEWQRHFETIDRNCQRWKSTLCFRFNHLCFWWSYIVINARNHTKLCLFISFFTLKLTFFCFFFECLSFLKFHHFQYNKKHFLTVLLITNGVLE